VFNNIFFFIYTLFIIQLVSQYPKGHLRLGGDEQTLKRVELETSKFFTAFL
jgi:hypothetical protein